MNHIFATIRGDMYAYIFGEVPLAVLLGSLLLALLGATFVKTVKVANRNPMSKRTPVQFDKGFFWRDNGLSMFVNLMAIFIGVTFFSRFFGSAASAFSSFMFGLGIDDFVKFIVPSVSKTNKRNMLYNYEFSSIGETDMIEEFDGTPVGLIAKEYAESNSFTLAAGVLTLPESAVPNGELSELKVLPFGATESSIRRPIRVPK